MWRDIGRVTRLGPCEFRHEFDRIYRDCKNIKTLWQLGGVTNDYLRANPSAITVPVDLPRRLLAAHHVDARVIGLKLLNRTDVSDVEIVRAIIRAMNRRDGYESCGGIYELDEFLDRRDISDIDSSLAYELCVALEPLANDGVATHGTASRQLKRLNGDPL
jgi:hypothetical protein